MERQKYELNGTLVAEEDFDLVEPESTETLNEFQHYTTLTPNVNTYVPFLATKKLTVTGNWSTEEVIDDFCTEGEPIPPEPGQPYFTGVTNRTINQGTGFDLTDGVKAYDGEGNEIPFTVSPSDVDLCTVGAQTFIYEAEGVSKERTITVRQIADPTISGLTPITVNKDETFDPMEGVSAVDGNGNTIEVTSDATNPMSYPDFGQYTITYTATDICGNTTTLTRGVSVEQQPYFDGLTAETISQGTDFDLEDGVTAYGSDGQEIPFTVSPNEVDICSVGTQTFTYTATGLTATREITVTQVANPTISGLTPLTVIVDEEFDPLDGVSAVDGNGNTVEVFVEQVLPSNIIVDEDITGIEVGAPTYLTQLDNVSAGEYVTATISNFVLVDSNGNEFAGTSDYVSDVLRITSGGSNDLWAWDRANDVSTTPDWRGVMNEFSFSYQNFNTGLYAFASNEGNDQSKTTIAGVRASYMLMERLD